MYQVNYDYRNRVDLDGSQVSIFQCYRALHDTSIVLSGTNSKQLKIYIHFLYMYTRCVSFKREEFKGSKKTQRQNRTRPRSRCLKTFDKKNEQMFENQYYINTRTRQFWFNNCHWINNYNSIVIVLFSFQEVKQHIHVNKIHPKFWKARHTMKDWYYSLYSSLCDFKMMVIF